MIETKMPKDIRAYKTKVIGPFTLREGFCIFLMIITNILLYSLVIRPSDLPIEFTVYVFIFTCLPFAALGWCEVAGMPLEKYLKNVILRMLACPTRRKVSSSIKMETTENKSKTEDENIGKKKAKKKERKQNQKKSEPVDPLMKGFL